MENEQNKPMQTPAPYAAGTGSVPVALDRDAFARMGYRERLALREACRGRRPRRPAGGGKPSPANYVHGSL
mgnify:CR=1 FL=1